MADLFAAWGDTLTGGLTSRIRDNITIGGNSINAGINQDSEAYRAGRAIGTAHSLALAFASPCGMARVAGMGLRALNGAQAAGVLDARDHIREGNYGAAALDIAGAAMSAMDVFGACFGAGTPILTPEGSKAVERFRKDDRVLSRDESDPAGRVEVRVVEEVFVRFAEVWHLEVGGQVIGTTAEHPFWAEGRGWTAAARLVEGDRLATLEGGWAVVGGVWSSGELATVYNMRVSEYHTYFVGDAAWGFNVWAHNTYNAPKGFPRTTPRLEEGNLKEGWKHIDARHVSGTAPGGAGDLFAPGTTRAQIEAGAKQLVAKGNRISDPSRQIQTFEKHMTINGKSARYRVVVDSADGNRIITMFPVEGGS